MTAKRKFKKCAWCGTTTDVTYNFGYELWVHCAQYDTQLQAIVALSTN